MNIKEYISTGILEAYVMGSLDQREAAEVEANLERYPELKEELTSVEVALEHMMMAAAKQPSPRVKTNVMASIEASSKANVITLRRNDIVVWRYATAASVVIAVASATLAIVFWNNWKSAASELSQLVAQNQQIAQDYNTVNQRLDKIEQDLKIYDNPSFRKIVMKGTASAPDAMASVYWNETSQEVFLSIQNLKSLARDQQYQLWAIVDGEPHDMGVFDSDMDGLVKMKPGEKIAAFAVTVEPRGGRPEPTMTTMQVFGATGSNTI